MSRDDPCFYLIVGSLDLPSIPDILGGDWCKQAWSRWMKTLSRSLEYSAFLDKCSQLPLSEYLLTLGKPIPHWSVTIGLPKLTRLNNFRIRLLVGCDGLEADACRFRARKYLGATGSAICRLWIGTRGPSAFYRPLYQSLTS